MKQKRKIVLALIFAMTVTFSLTACGGGDFDKTTFKIGSSTTVDTLNPLSAYESSSYEVIELVYDPLVRYDDNLEPEPCLATDWKISEDNLTWTFHLDQNAKWHDGEPVTSADVKYTYDLMIDTGLGYLYSAYLEGIEKITCPDDYTVVMTTKEPKANMLMNTTPIIPQHIWKDVAEAELETFANKEMIGSGPYKFVSNENGVVKITKNTEYFGTQGKVENLVFVEYKNTDSLAQALKIGEIDAAVNLSATQYSQLDEDGNITIIAGETLGFTQVGINCYENSKSKGNPLLKDKTIRQAIEYSINKAQIIEMAYGGFAIEGTTMINPSDFYHYQPPAGEMRSYNIDKAKELLENAGYKDTDGDGIREDSDGNKLINIGDNPDEVKTGQLIASTCKDAGIEIVQKTMDSGALQDAIDSADYDMFMWGWGSDYDPTSIMGLLLTSNIDSINEPRWSNSEYDRLHAHQQTVLDEKERQKEVYRMQQIAYDEAPYIILLYDSNLQAYRSDRWKGLKQIPENGPYYFNMVISNYINVEAK